MVPGSLLNRILAEIWLEQTGAGARDYYEDDGEEIGARENFSRIEITLDANLLKF